jgi:hypothetical protein
MDWTDVQGSLTGMDDIDPILQTTFDRRAAAWSAWGQLDDDLLTHLVNPSLTGGPRWPAMRQAFRVARRPDAVLVASDGLSDPFDDDEDDDAVNGFELEFYAVSNDPTVQIPGSWLFDLVWQMSQFAAKRGDVAELMGELGVLTTELYNVKIPEALQAKFVNASGRVGVMIGLLDQHVPDAIEGPLSSIQLLSLKLLTLDELAYCVEHGSNGREELARRFEASPSVVASSLSRASVV